MAKRASRKAGAESGSRKWLLVVIGAALAAVILGWWRFLPEQPERAKRVCLERLSMVVDRVDELAEVWQNRKTANTDGSGPDPKPERPAPRPGPMENSRPSPAEIPETQDEITPQDQEQLRELLREINEQ